MGVDESFKQQILSNVIGGMLGGFILLILSNRIAREVFNKERKENSKTIFEAVTFPELKYALERKFSDTTEEVNYIDGGSGKISNLYYFYEKNKLELVNFLNAHNKEALKEEWIKFYMLYRSGDVLHEILTELIIQKTYSFLKDNSLGNSYFKSIKTLIKWKFISPSADLDSFKGKHINYSLPENIKIDGIEAIWKHEDVRVIIDKILRVRSELLKIRNKIINLDSYII